MVRKLLGVLFLGIFLLSLIGSVSAGSVVIDSPIASVEYNYSIGSISWHYVGVLTADSRCFYDIGVGDQSFNCATNPVTTGITSVEGNNNWTISVQENVSIASVDRKSIEFYVDSVIPAINILSPTSEPFYTNLGFIFVNTTVTKGAFLFGDSNFSSYDYYVYKAGSLQGMFSLLGQPEYSFRYPAAATQTDGNYTYVLSLLDTYSDHLTLSHSNSITRNFVLDTRKPQVFITSPSNGANLFGTFTTTAIATDDRSGINHIDINVSLGAYSSLGPSPYLWDSTQAMMDGTATITATAYDNAGNFNSTAINVEIDNTAPQINFISPLGGTWQNVNQLINITALDVHLSNITLYVSGVPRFSTNNNAAELNYLLSEEGNQAVYANASDSFGHSNVTVVRNIMIDKSAPVTSNNYNGAWKNSNFNVNLSSSDTLSGVDYINYSYNGGAWMTAIGNNISVLINTEGNLTLTYFAVDNVGNIESTKTINVALDKTAPLVTLNGNVSLNLEVHNSYSDAGATAVDAQIGAVTVTDNSSLVNTNITGIYTINYVAQDLAGNINNTITRTVNVVDTTIPVITLIGANPQTIELGNGYSELGANASDNYDGIISGGIVINSSNFADAVGTYTITYNVNDSSGNNATQRSRTVNVVDTTKPVITLESPTAGTQFAFNASNLAFRFNVSDNNTIANCSLLVDSIEQNITLTVNKLLTQTLSFNLSIGQQHNWTITCIDASNNKQISELREVTVLPNFENGVNFDGNTTDLTVVFNISDVKFFLVGAVGGSINFTNSIDFSSGFDWSKFINITQNRIEVNSTGEPLLNVNATLTFYNLTWTNPQILRNGVVCSSPSCIISSYAGGILVFNVTGFSIYTTQETPVVTTTGGTGGGGGSYVPPKSVNSSTTNEIGVNTETGTNSENNPETDGGLGITGAITGGTAKALWIGGGFILLIAVVFIIVLLRRRAKTSEFAEKVRVQTV